MEMEMEMGIELSGVRWDWSKLQWMGFGQSIERSFIAGKAQTCYDMPEWQGRFMVELGVLIISLVLKSKSCGSHISHQKIKNLNRAAIVKSPSILVRIVLAPTEPVQKVLKPLPIRHLPCSSELRSLPKHNIWPSPANFVNPSCLNSSPSQ